jgi:hypothetical protein
MVLVAAESAARTRHSRRAYRSVGGARDIHLILRRSIAANHVASRSETDTERDSTYLYGSAAG